MWQKGSFVFVVYSLIKGIGSCAVIEWKKYFTHSTHKLSEKNTHTAHTSWVKKIFHTQHTQVEWNIVSSCFKFPLINGE